MSATLTDTENFKISSASWKVEDAIGVVNGHRVSIKVKIHPDGDVWEYVSGVPAEYIGQQLFTYQAAHRECSKSSVSLPEDVSALESIISSMPGATQQQQYQNYLSTATIKYSWCYSSWLHVFDDIGIRSYYRLADGTRLALGPTTWNVARRDESMWYMISLGK